MGGWQGMSLQQRFPPLRRDRRSQQEALGVARTVWCSLDPGEHISLTLTLKVRLTLSVSE